MDVVNTYFQKREEHRVTYKIGGRSTQIDYILCRSNLREIRDCKVVAGKSVAKQHWMVLCKIMMKMRKRKSVKSEQKIKSWKLRKEEFG